MRKIYTTPELSITHINNTDIITVSVATPESGATKVGVYGEKIGWSSLQ